MATAKEQCFEEALDSWESASGKKLGIDFQQWWTKNAAGMWERETFTQRVWWQVVNSWRKTKNFINGTGASPGSVQGLRRPDITMPGPNGKDIVVDLKFTDQKGKPDGWRDGQQEDYGDINRQNHGTGDVALDKNSCGCKGEPEPETVADPFALHQPGLYFVPVPAPQGLLGPSVAPAPAPIGPLIRIPIFP